MSLDAGLARGRAAAEARMVDTCVITRSADGEVDDNTGVITSGTQQVYTGPCRLQQSAIASSATDRTSGQDHQLINRLELHLPIAATGFAVGDRVQITAAGRDPGLVGMQLVVRDLDGKTDATARRIGVTRRTS